ncbi:MAG: hypothetical protein KatS3mg053_0848 [Candidatus Roseilinea sp.]|nr:MAG: hypothetical protein KatS3mg053_0848 [Candidatus Roseilinea sp.]
MTHALFGQWIGNAEVFAGDGHFVGNGMDVRHVQRVDDCHTRIDVSFIGPFKVSGHYFIHDCGDHRIYEGPVNVGYAEALCDGVVDANAYWPALGLSQRFLLAVLPDGDTQASLALMSRGDQLVYVVVGQNRRVTGEASLPELVCGTSLDLANDPTAGRAVMLLHREGTWHGELVALDARRRPIGQAPYSETLLPGNRVMREGGHFDPARRAFCFKTNGWQAWTMPDCEIAGSCGLAGGRASHGHFHHLPVRLRVWRREIATLDGARKVLVQHWYRGGERIGSEFGVLAFSPGG